MARKKLPQDLTDNSVVVPPQEGDDTPSELEKKRIDRLRRRPMYRAKITEMSLIQIQKQMADYFEIKNFDKKPPTLVGLANYLGVNKNSLKHYADVNPRFNKLYQMAKQLCEENIVEGTLTGRLQTVGGIFILKNHFSDDYQDKREVQASTAIFINADQITELKGKGRKNIKLIEDAKVIPQEIEEPKAIKEDSV